LKASSRKHQLCVYLISVCFRAEQFFMENNYKIIIMYLIHEKIVLIRLFRFNCIVNASVVEARFLARKTSCELGERLGGAFGA
jgi:hypothetical protein